MRCNDSAFYNGTACISGCLSGQYGDQLTRSCKACDLTCLTCNGGKLNNCLSCSTTYLH